MTIALGAMSRIAWVAVLLWVMITPAAAHTASNSFLYWGEDTLRLDISVWDLQRLSDLDQNADSQLTWRELKQSEATLARLIQQDLVLRHGGTACSLSAVLVGLSSYSEGHYAVWQLQSPCLAQDSATRELHYGLLFEIDPLHRALYRIEIPDAERLGVLAPGAEVIRGGISSAGDIFAMFFNEGVVHLITGFDHLLFLAALVLPYLRRSAQRDGWIEKSDCREIFWVVTAFTLAHSFSLVLATFSVVRIPAAPVEVAIAFSIGFAALLGMRGAGKSQRYLAGAFGLLHGLGFASMLAGLLASTDAKALALVGFNLGIELAQLLVLLAVLPVLLVLGRWRGFRQVFYPGSAVGLMVVSVVWGVQRLG